MNEAFVIALEGPNPAPGTGSQGAAALRRWILHLRAVWEGWKGRAQLRAALRVPL